jgi:hypothetical protein
MGLLRTLTAKTISRFTMGIVAPTQPRSLNIEINKGRNNAWRGVSDYAVLDFNYSGNTIISKQKNRYFKYENMELLDLSKLAKEDVLKTLDTIRDIGGLPDKARVLVLNKSLKNDTDIEAKINQLIEESDIVEGLVLRFNDVEINRAQQNELQEPTVDPELQAQANINEAHVFSIKIQSTEAQTENVVPKKTEAHTTQQTLTDPNAEVGNERPRLVEAQIRESNITNPEAQSGNQVIIDSSTGVSEHNARQTQIDAGNQVIIDCSIGIGETGSLETEIPVRVLEIVSPEASSSSKLVVDSSVATGSTGPMTTDANINSQNLVDPGVAFNNQTIISPTTTSSDVHGRPTSSENFLQIIRDNAFVFSAVALATMGNLYNSLTTNPEAETLSSRELATELNTHQYTTIDTPTMVLDELNGRKTQERIS